jgi:hypothetical protein
MEPVQLEDPCVECKQVCYFEKAAWAHAFGHIYSVDGLRTFMAEFLCEFCQDILADFQVFNARKDTTK